MVIILDVNKIMFNGFALNNIQNAYVGLIPAQAIYLGSTLIWPSAPHDYSQDYFTIVSLEDNNNIYFKIGTIHQNVLTIYVSMDDGLTWTSKTPYDNTGYGDYMVKLGTLNTNDKILLKGNNLSYSPSSGGSRSTHYFECSKQYNVEGNILSLMYGDNFISTTPSTLSDYAFQYLFCRVKVPTSDPTFGANTNLISTENLILPNVVGNACYNHMFNQCTALTTAPVLPASILKTSCYASMFSGCSSLGYIKCLATDISAAACTTGWCGNSNYYQFSSSGTFVKDANSTWPGGISGIPSGWTVINA